MNNLSNLNICVEKSLSSEDTNLVKESFGFSYETFKLPVLELFGTGTVSGTSSGGINPQFGSNYGINPTFGSNYGINPITGTLSTITQTPGIYSSEVTEIGKEERELEKQRQETRTPITITLSGQSADTIDVYYDPDVPGKDEANLNANIDYIQTTYGTETGNEILTGIDPFLLNTIPANVVATSEVISDLLNNDYTIIDHSVNFLGTVGETSFIHPVNPPKVLNYTILDPAIIKPIPVLVNTITNISNLNLPEPPSNPTVAALISYDRDVIPYSDLYKGINIDNQELSDYQTDYSDIFKSLETFEKEPLMMQRVKQYVNNGVFLLADPKLGIAQSVIQRQFYVRKMTISFNSDPENVRRTPLIQLEGMRDQDGNIIELDPIEYKIRNLSPIDAIKTVFRERIEPLVNIEFEFLDEKEGFNLLDEGIIRIGFNSDNGCWSMIGMDNFFTRDELTMNFAWLDAGTIMHEFGHMLGMIHEHQNVLGDSIKWDEPVVYAWAETVHGWDKETTYTNIIKKYEKNRLNGVVYDPRSIMLYYFPPQLTLDKKGTHQNLQLAVEDIKLLVSMYPGKNLNYKQFYFDIYGKNIEDEDQWFPKLIFIIIAGIVLFLIVKLYKRYKRLQIKTL